MNSVNVVDNLLPLHLNRISRSRARCQYHHNQSNLTQALGRIACVSDDEHTVAGSNTQVDGVPPFACSFGKTPDTLHLLATADEDGHVCLYDTKGTSKLVKEWSAHNNAIFDLQWADTEPWVLTASGDQTAALWDVSRGCRLAVFKQHSSSLKSASFRPGDRNVFATGARDGKIMVWDIRCNHKEGPPSYHTPVNTIADGHVPATPSTPKPAKRQRLASTPALSKSSVTAVAFQDEFSLISAGATESTIKVWDIRTVYKKSSRKPVPKQEFPYSGTSTRKIGFSSLILNSSRSCVYASCTDDVIYAFNCQGLNRYPVACYNGHSNATFYVKSALSVDDTFLLSGSSDSKAYIWKVNEPSQDPIQLTGHTAEVTSVAWSNQDFPKLVTCADDNSFRVWRLHNFSDDTLTQNKDKLIVGKAVTEKSKPRTSPVLTPCPSPSTRPPSRGCMSPLSPFTNLQPKPELKKNASIKKLFAKKKLPSSPEQNNNSSPKIPKLVPIIVTPIKTEHDATKENGSQNVENQQHSVIIPDAATVGKSEQSQACLQRNNSDKENETLCQKLPETPPRIPLSPRKGVNVHSTAPARKDETIKESMENKETDDSQSSCKENQRVFEGDRGDGARKMLSWPNSVDFSIHTKPSNPCQGCKVLSVSPVKRKRTGKITGYFKRLSKDKGSQLSS